MTVHPSAKNLVKETWKRRKSKPGFSATVKATIGARSGGLCELFVGCGAAVQYHHRAPRGAGGTSLPWVNQAANGLHVCRRHHDFIEAQRALAYAKGWLVARNGSLTAAEVPVLYRGRWVLLTDDGRVEPAGGPA
ncbi:hypothetical protein ACWDSF_06105 [Nocardia beijingensis]